MSNKHSAHSLLSDVTPWWWTAHWGQNEVQRAVNALLTTKRFSIDRIEISREQLQVKFALGDAEDANRTQERVDALKDVLDEMVAV
jgi:hypothetical protein